MPKTTIRGMALIFAVLSISMLALNVTKVAAVNVYDVNGDGKVDIQDLAITGKAFGTTPGHPRWNASADVNTNGKIDIVDLGLVAMHFGDVS
jgi:uncharacterized protein (DUF2141 family)